MAVNDDVACLLCKFLRNVRVFDTAVCDLVGHLQGRWLQVHEVRLRIRSIFHFSFFPFQFFLVITAVNQCDVADLQSLLDLATQATVILFLCLVLLLIAATLFGILLFYNLFCNCKYARKLLKILKRKKTAD